MKRYNVVHFYGNNTGKVLDRDTEPSENGEWVKYSDIEPRDKQLYRADIEVIPYLSTQGHELEEPVTSEEVVRLWDELRTRCVEAERKLSKIRTVSETSEWFDTPCAREVKKVLEEK